MTMKRNLISMTIAAAFALPTALAQQQAAQQPQAAARQGQQPVAILASKLIGKDVVNSRGEGLGEVRDLAVDLANNRVHYAMLDMQGKMFAYPMRTLRWTEGRDDVLLNVPEDRIERAPGMERSMWDRLTKQPPSGADSDRYWRDADAYWRDGATVKAQPRQNMRLVWGSKLIGWNVHNQANTDSIGEVKDFVVDPRDGSVKFVAVDFNDKIGGTDAAAFDDRVHPVPLDALATREGKDDLVLKADRAKLQVTQGFDEDRLDNMVGDKAAIDKAARYSDGLMPAGTTQSRN